MPSKKKVAKALRLIRKAEKLLRPKSKPEQVQTLLDLMTAPNPILDELQFTPR